MNKNKKEHWQLKSYLELKISFSLFSFFERYGNYSTTRQSEVDTHGENNLTTEDSILS